MGYGVELWIYCYKINLRSLEGFWVDLILYCPTSSSNEGFRMALYYYICIWDRQF